MAVHFGPCCNPVHKFKMFAYRLSTYSAIAMICCSIFSPDIKVFPEDAGIDRSSYSIQTFAPSTALQAITYLNVQPLGHHQHHHQRARRARTTTPSRPSPSALVHSTSTSQGRLPPAPADPFVAMGSPWGGLVDGLNMRCSWRIRDQGGIARRTLSLVFGAMLSSSTQQRPESLSPGCLDGLRRTCWCWRCPTTAAISSLEAAPDCLNG